MDGNGRWAKERGKERLMGHFEGVESVRVITELAAKAGVSYLSLYAFSEENWNRPSAEVQGLMELMMKCMKNELSLLQENNVRFRVLGNKERLSDELLDSIAFCEGQTANNTGLTMIIFLSYSGKWDILQASKRMMSDILSSDSTDKLNDIKKLELSDIDKYLVTAGIPDPDLIIRTSGEQRLSNYLLWQSAYSEFVFTDVLWPDFREEEFNKALNTFAKRDRRYGKVK